MQDNLDTPPIAKTISLLVLIGSFFWCLIGLVLYAAQ